MTLANNLTFKQAEFSHFHLLVIKITSTGTRTRTRTSLEMGLEDFQSQVAFGSPCFLGVVENVPSAALVHSAAMSPLSLWTLF